jgi:hypothetical protein
VSNETFNNETSVARAIQTAKLYIVFLYGNNGGGTKTSELKKNEQTNIGQSKPPTTAHVKNKFFLHSRD